MEYLVLAGLGIVANLAMIMFLKEGTWRIADLVDRVRLSMEGIHLDNRGEISVSGGEAEAKTVLLTQEQVDKVIHERLARERAKYADYEPLKQKVAEFEKMNSEKAQKDLEAGKQYEEAKKAYEGKIKTYEEKLAEKDRSISDMMIGNTLTSAISSSNGYVEESIALLKGNARIVDGAVKISMRDDNGIDQLLPVEEGVKRFLASRPHLVKSNARSGSGTGSGASESGGHVAEDLNSLNQQMQLAINTRDLKRQSELKSKMKVLMQSKGVNI